MARGALALALRWAALYTKLPVSRVLGTRRLRQARARHRRARLPNSISPGRVPQHRLSPPTLLPSFRTSLRSRRRHIPWFTTGFATAFRSPGLRGHRLHRQRPAQLGAPSRRRPQQQLRRKAWHRPLRPWSGINSRPAPRRLATANSAPGPRCIAWPLQGRRSSSAVSAHRGHHCPSGGAL